MQRGFVKSCGEVSEKKDKVRVNLAISPKRSVVERNGIKNFDPLGAKGYQRIIWGSFGEKG